jgi:hypothetical protein
VKIEGFGWTKNLRILWDARIKNNGRKRENRVNPNYNEYQIQQTKSV